MTTLDETRFFSPLDAEAGRLPATVTLVGAGPGDPELLTLKAARSLADARLVLYDKLVSKEVLKLVNPQADLIYVGKQSGHHVLTQDGIIELMVRIAKSGRSVLRLKGGDPYIFGRGGAVTHNTVSLNQHKIVTFDITDLQAANSSGARFDELAHQAGRALGDLVLQSIWKLVTTTNFGAATVTTSESLYTLNQLIDMRATLAGRNVDVDPGVCSFIHNVNIGAALLKTSNILNAYQIGDNTPARQGTLGRLVGCDPYETNILPTAATSLVAFLVHPDAINVAMRYLAPLAPQEYLAVERVADPSGIVMGYRRSFDQATGVMYGAFECLFGTATGLTLGLVHGTKP